MTARPKSEACLAGRGGEVTLPPTLCIEDARSADLIYLCISDTGHA